MDFIAETEKINKLKQEYENKIRTLFDEKYLRQIINNRCVTDSLYYKFESLNIYNPFDEKFLGKYDVDFNSVMGDEDTFTLTGYRWNKDLSGTQTDEKLISVTFNIFDFLSEINTNFSKLV